MAGSQGKGQRPARLVDVAALAGVSRATAARVLGGYSKVGDARSDKVLAAARELAYRANEVARAMRAGRTQTIGVVISDISTSFFGSAMLAIIDAAGQAGYQTLIASTSEHQEMEVEAVQTLIEKRVDGLIVVPSSPLGNSHLQAVAGAGVPTVLLDRRVPELEMVSVTSDDFAASRLAAAHLLERGHRRVALIAATSAVTSQGEERPGHVVSTVEDRVEGAFAAFREAGLPLPSEMRLVRYCRSEVAFAREAASALLDRASPPTAVLATNEATGLGVIEACMERGLAVGGDLSLISFDDSPWAPVHTPPITAIRRPVYDMGKAAVGSLVQALAGRRPAPTVLANEFVERSSVVDLRRA